MLILSHNLWNIQYIFDKTYNYNQQLQEGSGSQFPEK